MNNYIFILILYFNSYAVNQPRIYEIDPHIKAYFYKFYNHVFIIYFIAYMQCTKLDWSEK